MKIGAITVGQSPRTDVTADIFPIWRDRIQLIEAGALDEMTFDEVRALTPQQGDYVLVSRMRDGRQVTFAEKYLEPMLQDCIERLERQGVEMIVFFCTGEFPFTFRTSLPIIYPSDILNRLAPLLCGQKPLIVVTPSKLQLEQIEKKWLKHVPDVRVVYASPYGDIAELERACGEIGQMDGGLVVLDCIGYTAQMKSLVAHRTKKPVLLSRTLVARLLDELADID